MSPRSEDNLAITTSTSHELLFTSILEKNLDELAKSGATKKPRSDSLKKALDTTDSKRQCRRRRRVSFGSVSTREYNRVVGDNPCCRSGPPLGLGWTYEDGEEVSINAHQLKRARKNSIAGTTFFPLTDLERRIILKWDWCFTEVEMLQAQDEVMRIKLQRYETNAGKSLFKKAKKIGASYQRKLIRAIR